MTRDMRAYFDAAALYYDAVEAAFGPLAAHLVEAAKIQSGQCVLDLGTGSGLAARAAAENDAQVAALDFSAEMVRAARRLATPGVVRGDMHRLPFPDARFDAATAAFAFNSSDPVRAFPEVHRVLKPGGRLLVNEWGANDPISQLLSDTIFAYSVDDPTPDLAQQRAELDMPLPWDQFESMDDLAAALMGVGFAIIEAAVIEPVVLLHPEQFIAYKLAWPARRKEVDAMSDEVRRLFFSDLEENLGALAESDGLLRWKPRIVRVIAEK